MFSCNVITTEARENDNKVEGTQRKSQRGVGSDREVKGGFSSCGSVSSPGSRFHL